MGRARGGETVTILFGNQRKAEGESGWEWRGGNWIPKVSVVFLKKVA